MKSPFGPRKTKALEAIRTEFLPAALELESSPASPLGRGILWTIMVMFVAAVVWACIGKVDVVAIAEGAILPHDRTRVVQPSALGIVAGIHARNGDRVAAGQPLITLDGTTTRADVDRLRQTLGQRERHLERLQNFVERVAAHHEQLNGDAAAGSNSEMDLLLSMQLQSLSAAISTLEEQRAARQGELAYATAVVDRIESTLPLMQERAQAIRTMLEDSLAPRSQWLELEQDVRDARGHLNAERHRVHQLQSEIRELETRRQQLVFETIRDNLGEIDRLKTEIQELRQELIKAEELNRQRVLVAPVTGVIHDSQVNTVGSVVQPAEPLMKVIPDDEPLIVEAWIRNRDIGFVQVGQQASLKIQTFEFTRYGTVPGTVKHLSHDAVIDETAGPRYMARIELERDWMDVNGRQVGFAPGMSVSAEIAIGQRRLIEFFAAPIVSALNETGRER